MKSLHELWGPSACTAEACMDNQAQCLTDNPPHTCADPNTAGCEHPNTWHVLTSGIFTETSAQDTDLNVTVPIPPSTDTSLTDLVYTIPKLDLGGCDQGVLPLVACHPDAGSCDIQLHNVAAPLSDWSCAIDDACPCSNKSAPYSDITGQVDDCNGWTYHTFDACNPQGPDGNTHIAFAKDIRVEWVDPDDAWECNCLCDDPTAPDTPFVAAVIGRAPHGLADDEQDDIDTACSAVCGSGPRISLGEPASRIGACHAPPDGTAFGRLVIDNAYQDPPPVDRPSPTGDYRVMLDPAQSLARVGTVDSVFGFDEKASAPVKGNISFALDPSGQHIEVGEVNVLVGSFSISGFLGFGGADFSDVRGLVLNRFQGTKTPLGYLVEPAQFNIAVEWSMGGPLETARFPNYGPALITVDLQKNIFTLSAQGDDGAGHGLVLNLTGNIINHPPVAKAGADQTVECTSPLGAQINLDATASTDPDPGDQVIRFQWFEGANPLTDAPKPQLQASLGTHTYELHAYDRNLGSGQDLKGVHVVDTTPPVLTLPPGQFCLWPPNHTFARFTLQNMPVTAADRCDTAPSLRIVSVTSSETADAGGSGNTSPDVLFGPATACVRSERSGDGTGRQYDVTVEATDSSGNTSRGVVKIVVPHDQSGFPQCTAVEGINTLEGSCEQ